MSDQSETGRVLGVERIAEIQRANNALFGHVVSDVIDDVLASHEALRVALLTAETHLRNSQEIRASLTKERDELRGQFDQMLADRNEAVNRAIQFHEGLSVLLKLVPRRPSPDKDG